MNREQINQLNMMDAVDQLLTTYNSVWSTNTAVSGIVTTFRGHLGALNVNDTLQRTISTGVSMTKDEAKAAMISAAIMTCHAGKAYASVAGNTDLYAQMKHTKSEIAVAADTDADGICQNIHDDLDPYIGFTVAYGATTLTQSNLQNAINTFSGMIGKPRVQIGIVKNATLTIEQHLTASMNLLKDQLDGVLMQYATSNARFLNEYASVRVIVDIGHRHTVIFKGFIYDPTHNALEGVLVELTGAPHKHKKITDATGKYRFTRLHPGTYVITISKAGYVTQTKTITVS
ncbi:MAG: carboxypeptidase-like regulatory domain-containing protein, partial [Bacteroidia bacterium]